MSPTVNKASPLAVALKYTHPHAPKVVAVGRGDVGRRIIEVAEKNGVPLQEDPALAEALSTIDIGEDIPPELYKAVAVVLSFILKKSGHLK